MCILDLEPGPEDDVLFEFNLWSDAAAQCDRFRAHTTDIQFIALSEHIQVPVQCRHRRVLGTSPSAQPTPGIHPALDR